MSDKKNVLVVSPYPLATTPETFTAHSGRHVQPIISPRDGNMDVNSRRHALEVTNYLHNTVVIAFGLLNFGPPLFYISSRRLGSDRGRRASACRGSRAREAAKSTDQIYLKDKSGDGM